MSDPLAAVVRKPDAEAAIAALRDAGAYDDERRVRERDDDTVEVPVAVPSGDGDGADDGNDGDGDDLPTGVTADWLDGVDALDVVRQADPEFRPSGLPDLLRERGFSEAEVERAPGSWAVVGSVVLVSFGDCERREEVGEALLELHGEADTVLARHGIQGEHREPDVEVVAGDGDTETVHTEHGTRYALDLARVMFSPGNKAERARMGDVVEAEEAVLDMFAGVGYFALPMARGGADVTAVERNPVAFQYLLENAVLNGVEDRVTPIRADCRDAVADAVERGDAPFADRVVMGYYDAHEYLDAALDALRPGGVVHLHEATPEVLAFDRPVSRLTDAAEARGRELTVLDRRVVKTHSEGVEHVVVDARIT
jgi:tRNA wybutosine-synthesizing protein 2